MGCDYQLLVVCLKGSEWKWEHVAQLYGADATIKLDVKDDLKLTAPSHKKEYESGKYKPNRANALELAQIYALCKACKNPDRHIKKAITFHGNIVPSRRTQIIAEHLLTKENGDTNKKKCYYYIDSQMKQSEKDKNMKDFKNNDVAWISNPSMLAVGIDVPEMQCAAMFENIKSPVNTIQIIGRPLRMDPNNRLKKAYIVSPYFVDATEDYKDDELFWNGERKESAENGVPIVEKKRKAAATSNAQ